MFIIKSSKFGDRWDIPTNSDEKYSIFNDSALYNTLKPGKYNLIESEIGDFSAWWQLRRGIADRFISIHHKNNPTPTYFCSNLFLKVTQIDLKPGECKRYMLKEVNEEIL